MILTDFFIFSFQSSFVELIFLFIPFMHYSPICFQYSFSSRTFILKHLKYLHGSQISDRFFVIVFRLVVFLSLSKHLKFHSQ